MDRLLRKPDLEKGIKRLTRDCVDVPGIVRIFWRHKLRRQPAF